MKRPALIPLLVGLVVGSCAIDRRPPYGSPPYRAARAKLKQARDEFLVETGPYFAGWARAPIVVPAHAPIAGYRREDRTHRGIRDPIFVRAFAFSTEGGAPVVYLVSDLLAADRDLTEVVRDRLEPILLRSRVHFSATHTHSSLGGYVSRFPFELTTGRFHREAFEGLVAVHEQAAREALDRMAPARIGSAEVHAPGACRNRVELGAPVDDSILVVHFEHLASGARATLVSQACHPTVLGPEHDRISADFPGALAARFEGRGFEVVGIAAGAVGNGQPAHDSIEAMAQALAGPLEVALESARAGASASGRLASHSIELPVPRLSVAPFGDFAFWSPLAEAVLAPRFSFELTVVGDTAILGLPVELAGRLGELWRRRLARRGLRLVFSSFGGDYLGYVNPRETFDLPAARRGPGYENELQTLSFLGPAGAEVVLGLGDALLSTIPQRW